MSAVFTFYQEVSLIKSCLFFSGKKSNLYDQLNPDWAPTVNLGLKRKQPCPDRYARQRKRLLSASAFENRDVNLCSENEELPEPAVTDTGISCQTDIGLELMTAMQDELQQLRVENMELKRRLNGYTTRYEIDYFADNNEKVKHFTGLPDFLTLTILFEHIKDFLPSSFVMGKFKMFILTLVKLRLNMSNVFLAYEFDTTQPTVSRLFTSCISTLYKRLSRLIRWPEKEPLKKTMPMEFRKNFAKKCTVIIDCFEVFCEKPSGLTARAETWSSYKHHHTVKYLIGITPQGTVSYLSNGWGGRVSDKYITENCGFLDKLLPGDLVLADRGFNIAESVGMVSAEVKIPAFTKGKDQLSPLDVESTRKLAHSRIHVERVIGSVRQKYSILNGSVPISFLMNKDIEGRCVMDKVATVACGLVNLCESIVNFD